MNKKELIAILADYPDDTEIYIDMLNDDQYEDDTIWISSVRDPYDTTVINKYKRVHDMKICQRAHKDNAGAKKCLVL